MRDFDLKTFTPYLLNMAAEASGAAFQNVYRSRYGMLRAEWRVLFHLGRYGDLTATEICRRARMHKTKVSRAVTALEAKRLLWRATVEADRRHATLALTLSGQKAFQDLVAAAARFDEELLNKLSSKEREVLKSCLVKLAEL